MKTNFVSECVHYSDVSHDREQKILNGSLYTISKVSVFPRWKLILQYKNLYLLLKITLKDNKLDQGFPF